MYSIRRERGDINTNHSRSSSSNNNYYHNSETTTNTTPGVMHNLPVLWLAVGLLSLCHAPVPIVGQLEVALLLCVVHAVEWAVSVPGLWSRQQWQLVWAGPRVSLRSTAEPGHPGGCGQPWHKGCDQQKGPGFSLSRSLSPLHLKSHPQTVTDWEKDHGRDESMTTLDPGSAFVQWTDLLQINKSTCRNAVYAFFLTFLLLLWKPWCFATWHALVAAGLYSLVSPESYFSIKMYNTPVAQDSRLISSRLELIKHKLLYKKVHFLATQKYVRRPSFYFKGEFFYLYNHTQAFMD